jgi:predicted dehydrogenase
VSPRPDREGGVAVGAIGVAVIGAGMAGRSHAQAYRSVTTMNAANELDVRLVAIADVNADFAQLTQDRYGFARSETSWQAVADADDVDVVSVVVANALHREIAEGLLAAGKHVLCEKPLAPSTADAESMVAAAEQSGRSAATGFCYRRSPGAKAIADLIAAGALGEIMHLNGRYWCDYAANPAAPTSWRYAGGLGSGALGDLGSHLADLSEQLCGPITAVRGAELPIVIRERPVPLVAAVGHAAGVAVSDERAPVTNEDIALFTAEFASGAVGTLSISRIAVGYGNGLAFEVFGTRGAARFDVERPGEFWVVDSATPVGLHGWRRVLVGPEHPYIADGLAMPFPGVGFGGQEYFTYQARAFLEEVAGLDGLPRCATFADGLHNLRVEEAVVAAAENGGTVAVAA